MKDEDLSWVDIDKARNMLLSRSDWTQLFDSGLSTECVIEWRKWRSAVRAVTQSSMKERIAAKKRLQELNSNKPDEVKGDLDIRGLLSGTPVVTRENVKSLVEDILHEHGYEIVEKADDDVVVEPSRRELKDSVCDELHSIYINKIEEISPHPSLSIAYMERLNEAIDCLSEQGMSFPLIDDEAINVKEEAAKIVKDHGNLIHRYARITKAYDNFRFQTTVLSVDDIANLPSKLREELNGY